MPALCRVILQQREEPQLRGRATDHAVFKRVLAFGQQIVFGPHQEIHRPLAES